MPARPIGIDQRADQLGAGGADAVQVDDETSRSLAYGCVDQDVAQLRRRPIVHVAGYRDQRTSLRHVRTDLHCIGDHGKTVGSAVELLPQRLKCPSEQARDVHL